MLLVRTFPVYIPCRPCLTKISHGAEIFTKYNFDNRQKRDYSFLTLLIHRFILKRKCASRDDWLRTIKYFRKSCCLNHVKETHALDWLPASKGVHPLTISYWFVGASKNTFEMKWVFEEGKVLLASDLARKPSKIVDANYDSKSQS